MSAENRSTKSDTLLPTNQAHDQRDRLIADAMARVSLSKLRSLPITTRQRAGAFMISSLRKEGCVCAVFLDSGASVIGEYHSNIGPSWYADALADDLVRAAEHYNADLMILGTTIPIPWEKIAPFDRVYRILKENGVELIDLIEISAASYRSLFKQLTPGKSDIYEEFKK